MEIEKTEDHTAAAMPAVLIPVGDKWCERIAEGKKTIEVRKTKPRCQTPFKVYIYCTKQKKGNALHLYINEAKSRPERNVTNRWRSGAEVVDVNAHLPAYRFLDYLAEGRVIGEFVCDGVLTFDPKSGKGLTWLEKTCLTCEELEAYAKGKSVVGWHISGLQIYDKPLELGEFSEFCKVDSQHCKNCEHFVLGTDLTGETCRFCNTHHRRKLSRPPMSWMYVERGCEDG